MPTNDKDTGLNDAPSDSLAPDKSGTLVGNTDGVSGVVPLPPQTAPSHPEALAIQQIGPVTKYDVNLVFIRDQDDFQNVVNSITQDCPIPDVPEPPHNNSAQVSMLNNGNSLVFTVDSRDIITSGDGGLVRDFISTQLNLLYSRYKQAQEPTLIEEQSKIQQAEIAAAQTPVKQVQAPSVDAPNPNPLLEGV